ncbi:leucyl aminopeptidase [Gemmatimonadota bacterium]
MRIVLKQVEVVGWKGEALVTGAWEAKAPKEAGLGAIEKATDGSLSDAWGDEAFNGREGSTLLIQRPPGLALRRLVLAGLGPRERADVNSIRRLGGMASRRLLKEGVAEIAVVLPDDHSEPRHVEACVEGFMLGGGGIDAYKTGNRKTGNRKIGNRKTGRTDDPYHPPYRQLTLLLPDRVTAAHRGAVTSATATSEGVILARRLVNTPANRMTPTDLAREARRACRSAGLTVTVWGKKELREKGFGGLLAVTSGSAQPPRFIVMRYAPEGQRAASRAPLALVGKGVTFDSGGISIKPSKGMEEMKADMAGAAAVIGAMSAIGRLRPPRPVLGIVPACENMPSGTATRPGDVIDTYSGKTIEVLNTDAEGRLILADGLAWAAGQKPQAIVDIATLTGACVVALGHVYAGLMGNDDGWVETVRACAIERGEKVWPLPMDREYDALVESDIADVRNTGKDQPGAITAAKLLEKFVGDVPWAHLDIAGVEWRKEPAAWAGPGPTGFGVRTFVGLAMRD